MRCSLTPKSCSSILRPLGPQRSGNVAKRTRRWTFLGGFPSRRYPHLMYRRPAGRNLSLDAVPNAQPMLPRKKMVGEGEVLSHPEDDAAIRQSDVSSAVGSDVEEGEGGFVFLYR